MRSSIQIAATEIHKLHLLEEFRDDAVCRRIVAKTWLCIAQRSCNLLVWTVKSVLIIISMDSGKCVDYNIMKKMCKSFESMEKNKGTEEYDNYLKVDDCPINHKGSAGSMEYAGVMRCFERSIKFNNLCYKKYIGDSSSYASVVKAEPLSWITYTKRRMYRTYAEVHRFMFEKVKKGIWEDKTF